MNKLPGTFLAGLFLVGTSSISHASKVDFDIFLASSGFHWGYGFFIGNDGNSDDVLALSELTDLEVHFTGHGGDDLKASLSDVSLMGTYTISTNTWSNDVERSDTGNFDAWLTYGVNNQSNLASNWATLTTTLDPVPIPGAVWLLGSGLLGLLSLKGEKE